VFSQPTKQTMTKANYQIIGLYFLAITSFYPVVAHILMYQLGLLIDKLPHGTFWIYTQIFISGPALIILGLLLYCKYGYLIVNKICGVLFFSIGSCWLYVLISDIVNESA
jgi:hypothetical protein